MAENIETILNTVRELGGNICLADNSEELRKYEEFSTKSSELIAEPLESFGIYPVSAGCSEVSLDYFVDGVQRSLVISKLYVDNCGYFPVYYSSLISGIIHRENRQLSVLDLGDGKTHEMANIGIIPKSGITKHIHSGNIWYYSCLDGNAAHSICSLVRRSLEQKCLEHWASLIKLPNYLLVDGGITYLGGRVHNAIGVIKNIQSTYLTPSQFKKIATGLREGHRSHFFTITYPEIEKSVVSCFIRLHEGKDMTGLVRFEAPLTLLSDLNSDFMPHMNALITQITTENTPSIYPTIRWDRQLYPVQACEDYLRSHIPSLGILKATIYSYL